MGQNIPPVTTRHYDLPLSHLHVMEGGAGPPLVIVPATISDLEAWVDLVQFMAQWFHVYFFELPGHGASSSFASAFSSSQVALLVEQLVDFLGINQFSLMGFSFGGVLAMKTYLHLAQRIDRLILLAPCLNCDALTLPPWRQHVLSIFNQAVNNRMVQPYFYRLLTHPRTVAYIVWLLQRLGRLESTIPLQHRLLKLKRHTLDVLARQIDEILSVNFPRPAQAYTTPCYFAMSLYDPLLDYQTTLHTLRGFFPAPQVQELTFPFHQPPRPFTFTELNAMFGAAVQAFLADPLP